VLVRLGRLVRLRGPGQRLHPDVLQGHGGDGLHRPADELRGDRVHRQARPLGAQVLLVEEEDAVHPAVVHGPAEAQAGVLAAGVEAVGELLDAAGLRVEPVEVLVRSVGARARREGDLHLLEVALPPALEPEVLLEDQRVVEAKRQEGEVDPRAREVAGGLLAVLVESHGLAAVPALRGAVGHPHPARLAVHLASHVVLEEAPVDPGEDVEAAGFRADPQLGLGMAVQLASVVLDRPVDDRHLPDLVLLGFGEFGLERRSRRDGQDGQGGEDDGFPHDRPILTASRPRTPASSPGCRASSSGAWPSWPACRAPGQRKGPRSPGALGAAGARARAGV
jgi:hypothetical protein